MAMIIRNKKKGINKADFTKMKEKIKEPRPPHSHVPLFIGSTIAPFTLSASV